jgi:predicted phosphate transport protein (TIGR00153 family)
MALKFIRSLMPREERFVANFTAHADRLVAASGALIAMMEASPADREARFADVRAIENQADTIARETLVALHRAFITPFDRSDIHALITAQDDTVDLIEDVGQHALLYKIDNFSPRMVELAVLIQDGARLLAEAIPLLTDVNRNVGRINVLCEKVGRIESDADKVLHQGLSELIAEQPETITFLGRKEVYEMLEAVTDRCDDVADLIEGILLDHV